MTPTGDIDTKIQARLKEFREALTSRINEINIQVRRTSLVDCAATMVKPCSMVSRVGVAAGVVMFSILHRGGVMFSILHRGGVMFSILHRGVVMFSILHRGGIMLSILHRGGVMFSILHRGLSPPNFDYGGGDVAPTVSLHCFLFVDFVPHSQHHQVPCCANVGMFYSHLILLETSKNSCEFQSSLLKQNLRSIGTEILS